jgi:hypothetical protein
VGPSDRRVVLYTRPGCHLCDVARAVVAGVTSARGAGFDEVDIRTSRDLLLEHGARVPVVEVDGREVAHFRVSPEALRAALDGGRPDPS